ncbi:MAG TPA: FAD binding domain-containing protein [Caldimonas sp.]|nr:FAD binding domain-containing protein [Caldimonas sp.]
MPVGYERPASIDDATRLLATGGWQVLAGGTDLYPAHVGRPLRRPLLDIGGIPSLRGIRRTAAGWSIGAATTWTDVLRADLPPLFDALKQAAREVGGVQVQNTATVAGNLCNASPAADGTPVLMALDAVVVLRGAEGERRVAAVDFVLGSRRTACQAHELVVAIEIPARSDGARSAFMKLGGRRYLTISVTMVAVVVETDDKGRVAHAAAAVGSCAATARRLPALEQRLVGAASSDVAAVAQPADLVPLTPIDDMRGSAAYRLDATATLLRRALASLLPSTA